MSIIIVSSACAADSNGTDEITADEVDIDENDSLKLSNEETVGNDGGHHSFTELQSLINGVKNKGDIYLEHDYAYDPDVDEDLAKGMTFFNNSDNDDEYYSLNLYGNGHVIDGANQSGIFLINNEKYHVNFYNLQIINGNRVGDYFDGDHSFDDDDDDLLDACDLDYGYGDDDDDDWDDYEDDEIYDYGAAIYNAGIIALYNCYFENNLAFSGGAIESYGRMKLYNCSFHNNKAASGGAITNYGIIELNNCSFYNNSAEESAGAVQLADLESTALINGCSFYYNTAAEDGGAVVMFYQDSILDDCYFYANNAANGGAVYTRGVSTIFNCSFENNTADYGGALYNRFDKLSVNLSNFTGNHADFEGGAIFNEPSNRKIIHIDIGTGAIEFHYGGSINISDSIFSENGCTDKGGAISSYSDLDIDNSSFIGCTSRYGGAVATFYYAHISDSRFLDNVADYYGGAIYNPLFNQYDDSSACDIRGSYFQNDRADYGGAVHNGIAMDCIFEDNFAKYYGNDMYYGVNINCSGDSYYRTTDISEYNGLLFTVNKITEITDSRLAVEINVTNSIDGKPVPGVCVRFQLGCPFNFEHGTMWRFNNTLVTDENGIARFNITYGPSDIVLHEGSSSIIGKIDDNHLYDWVDDYMNVFLYNRDYSDIIVEGYLNEYVDVDSGVEFSNDIVIDYGGSGSANFTLNGASGITASIMDNADASVSINDNIIFVSGLDSGNYVLIAETIPDRFHNPVNATLNVGVRKLSKITFTAGMVFEYGASGVIHMVVEGGTVTAGNVEVVGHPEAIITLAGNDITVSNLNVGSYTLKVVSTPEEGASSATGTTSITVRKATAVIQASKLTVAYKKGTKWTVRLVNSRTGNPIANMELTLKVFTGSKYKTVKVRTNSRGEATYQTKSLSKGTHKVIVSASHSQYNFNTLTSSIKVVKPKKLNIMVRKMTAKDGASLSITVKDKKTKKPLNGVKLKLLIYTGKKYKTVILKTKSQGKYKGVAGYATNKLSVGKHKVKIMPVSIKYSGTKTSSMKIKKSAKRYVGWVVKLSG